MKCLVFTSLVWSDIVRKNIEALNIKYILFQQIHCVQWLQFHLHFGGAVQPIGIRPNIGQTHGGMKSKEDDKR